MIVEVHVVATVSPHESGGDPDLPSVGIHSHGICEVRTHAVSVGTVLSVARNGSGGMYEQLPVEIQQLLEATKGVPLQVPFHKKTTRTILCPKRGRLRANATISIQVVSVPRIS